MRAYLQYLNLLDPPLAGRSLLRIVDAACIRAVAVLLTVYPTGKGLVDLVTDPALDRRETITVKELVVRPEGNQQTIILQLNVDHPPPVAISVDVKLRLDKQIHDFDFASSRGRDKYFNVPDSVQQALTRADIFL